VVYFGPQAERFGLFQGIVLIFPNGGPTKAGRVFLLPVQFAREGMADLV
jgi:hypothetical protein